MKYILHILLISNLFICSLLNAQSINLTLGTGGIFTIKDSSTNYFTINQSTGQVNITKGLRLENTLINGPGTVYFGDFRFMHNYGIASTYLGTNAGNFPFTPTIGGNTGIGYYSLSSLILGDGNTALGSNTLRLNTYGSYNTAIGYQSLTSNISGNLNTAVGRMSLFYNATSNGNTAVGFQSLYFNSSGYSNTSVGLHSLYLNTSGSNNTSIGDSSLFSNTTGSNNIGIGFNAQVPSGTSSNQVRIGDINITYAGIQVPWTITSDRRWKSNILSSNLGLGFINKLRPVSYTRKNDESQKTEYGFIAQEVEEVLKETGTENTGMITVTDEGMYELRYNDLLAPMVKAMQELNEKCTTLETENSQLKGEVESLKDIKVKLAELEKSQIEMMKIIKSNSSKEIKSVKITDNK